MCHVIHEQKSIRLHRKQKILFVKLTNYKPFDTKSVLLVQLERDTLRCRSVGTPTPLSKREELCFCSCLDNTQGGANSFAPKCIYFETLYVSDCDDRKCSLLLRKSLIK